ncbi:MAG: RNA methyltransferase [Bacteroidales bacterium]|nr:RNA methyltransferase [Bacteroidales bacterium]
MDPYLLALIEHLSGCITESRLSLFKQVLSERTRYITVVLEDIYQSHNASAVLRTCDCTGIQDVHIVEQRNEYETNRDVALGSDQWLSLHHYNEGTDSNSEGTDTITSAVGELKKRGYRIVATSPHTDGTTPETFDLERGKAAFIFGTELNGLTDHAMELADEHIQIPMVGFTESYNISVSAAILLYHLRGRLNTSILDWKIGEEERSHLLLDWLRTSIKMSEQIEDQFRKDYHSNF